MWRRMWCACVVLPVVLVVACWSSEPLVQGTFTQDQWTKLTDELKLPALDASDLCDFADPQACNRAVELGKRLFFEPRLSEKGNVSCASCHDTNGGFADTRAENNVSASATGWTKRNAIATVNAAFKEKLAAGRPCFGWIGGYKGKDGVKDLILASDVVDLAMEKAMSSTPDIVKTAIASDAAIHGLYDGLFGPLAMHSPTAVVANVKRAFEAYLRKQYTRGSAFDRFLAGDRDALSDSEQRGFVIFATRGMCMECHRQALLTDFDYHVTGVPQLGTHVDPIPMSKETGRKEVTGDPADLGKFMTPSLRDLSRTGPYMHDGSLATLADVVAFYNDGGGSRDFLGSKDPRLEPLGLDGADERDLEAFLGSLEGVPEDPPPPGWCPTGGETRCGDTCVDLQNDPDNCSACGASCAPLICRNAQCVPDEPQCGPTGQLCGPPGMQICVDTASDPTNCGMCGHVCATGQFCYMGGCM